MPVVAHVGKNQYPSTKSLHAEIQILRAYPAGNLSFSIDAWPCVDGCHPALIFASRNRVITVTITGDHGGYAADHGQAANATGTMTYNNGVVSLNGTVIHTHVFAAPAAAKKESKKEKKAKKMANQGKKHR